MCGLVFAVHAIDLFGLGRGKTSVDQEILKLVIVAGAFESKRPPKQTLIFSPTDEIPRDAAPKTFHTTWISPLF